MSEVKTNEATPNVKEQGDGWKSTGFTDRHIQSADQMAIKRSDDSLSKINLLGAGSVGQVTGPARHEWGSGSGTAECLDVKEKESSTNYIIKLARS